MRRFLLALLLVAVSASAGHYYKFTPHTTNTVCLQVTWVPSESVAEKVCGVKGYHACAFVQKDLNGRIRQDIRHEIVVPMIRDFNDSARLELLGHEVYHLLGGEHN